MLRCTDLHPEPIEYSNQAMKHYYTQTQLTYDGNQVYVMKISHTYILRIQWEDTNGAYQNKWGVWVPARPAPDFMMAKPIDVDFDVDHAMEMPGMK